MMPSINIEETFQKFVGLRVLIVGDVMVDSYVTGKVDRVSPEAPVPVVDVKKFDSRLGGAGNVALNIKAMGGIPIICSVIGKDKEGESLKTLDLLEFHGQGTLEEVARECIFLAASQVNEQKQRDFLFQKGKQWIDEGLGKDEENMPLRNALIIYQSEYLNQPMAFLKTLKASQKIDSSDVELNFIHLNLLKKSNQWQKAIQKCEKLVSLQPQNPYWLFEMSDLYGTMGDSANAKVYLNLAIERQRKQSEK